MSKEEERILEGKGKESEGKKFRIGEESEGKDSDNGGSRYPKRNIQRIDYAEMNAPMDDLDMDAHIFPVCKS